MINRNALLTLVATMIITIMTSCDSGKVKFKLNEDRGWHYIMIDEGGKAEQDDGYYMFDSLNISHIEGTVLDGSKGLRIYAPDGRELVDGQYKYLRYSKAPSFYMYCLYYPSEAELNTGENREDQTLKEAILGKERSALIEKGIIY